MTQSMPCFHHDAVDGVEKQLVQTVLLQQTAELQQRCRVGHIFLQKVDSDELPHGVAVVDRVLRPLVGQIEPYLQQIHPQHELDPLGRTAALSAGVKGHDDTDPLIPRNDLIHDFKKHFAFGLALAIAVLKITERLLLHITHRLLFRCLYYTISAPVWGGLNQRFLRYCRIRRGICVRYTRS